MSGGPSYKKEETYWLTGKPCYTITELQFQHSLSLLDSNRIDCIVAIPRSLCEISCPTLFF